jgi:hypothetical protein
MGTFFLKEDIARYKRIETLDFISQKHNITERCMYIWQHQEGFHMYFKRELDAI